MLGSATITALVGTMKPEVSKAFYQDILGLKFVNDDTYAMVFEGKNARVRVSRALSWLCCCHRPSRVETLKSCQRWLRLKLACQVRLSCGSRCGCSGCGGGRDREAVPWRWGHGPLRGPPNLPLPMPIEP